MLPHYEEIKLQFSISFITSILSGKTSTFHISPVFKFKTQQRNKSGSTFKNYWSSSILFRDQKSEIRGERKEGGVSPVRIQCYAGRPLAVVIIKVLNRPWQVQNSWQPTGPALSFQGVRVTFRGGSALSDRKDSRASHAPSPCPGARDGCPPAFRWNCRAPPPHHQK